MFQNDLLDKLTRIHFSVPLFIFVPVILYFIYQSFFTLGLTILAFGAYLVFGLFIWTLTEYVLHRFVFHWCPPGKWGERIHFIFHGVHHDYPSDSKRLVMVPTVSIPLAALFFWLFRLMIGPVHVAPFFVGFCVGICFMT